MVSQYINRTYRLIPFAEHYVIQTDVPGLRFKPQWKAKQPPKKNCRLLEKP